VFLGIAVIVAAFALTPPIPQDPAYHRFADGRTLFGIPNALNVLSNAPFLVFGAWGLLAPPRLHVPPVLRPAYGVFFAGILLTAFGSGYYHLAPANAPLVWDRLPMTIGFAGLFAIVVGEFLSLPAALRLLWPLLAAGLASVGYWAWTEARGGGDLRPYAIVQFLPMLLTIVILARYRGTNTLRGWFAAMVACYVLAKLAEFLDAGLFAAGAIISGHSLKHLFAAGVPAILLAGLARRATV